MEKPISTAQKAINFLVKSRDVHYLQSVNATGSALLYHGDNSSFAPGSTVFQALKRGQKATIACNVVSYNQLEGHLRAAMKQKAILILEVARSQLKYALDEIKAVRYIKEVMAKINCQIPAVLHGDHIQYEQKLFDQKAVLNEVYQAETGQALEKGKNILELEESILRKAQDKLKQNMQSERQAVTDVIIRLIKAGFTSVAIDASTIYDEMASNFVLNYYEKNGTAAEKLIVKLEKEFALSLEWGAEIFKLDLEKNQEKFAEMKEDIISEMKKRNKEEEKIQARVWEFENAFGVLARAARESDIALAELSGAYEKIMACVAKATISGEIDQEILSALSLKQKLLLLPTSNAAETAHQLKMIKEILRQNNSEIKNSFGIEVEVGHIDGKVPNPRLGGKLECKVTHPLAVKTMGEYLRGQGLVFDLIATNNGSGHGTEFDKTTLAPISQVDKISPYLTAELQREAEKFGASLAQHGTTGSDMDEIAELARRGIIKFNIATNYQHIILNVFSLLDNGLAEDKLMDQVWSEQIALMSGLAAGTRDNIKAVAQEIASDPENVKIKENDSLFRKILKYTYVWAQEKGKIGPTASREEIAAIFAKEYRRVFGKMDGEFYKLATTRSLFRIGQEPNGEAPDDIAARAASITAAVLTHDGLRGRAKNLDKKIPEQKELIHQIKDEADGRAKKIYEKIIKKSKTIMVVRASEGFARDQVAESFKSGDIILPERIRGEIDFIKDALDNKKEKKYRAKNGEEFTIEQAIVDVIEGTNQFVANVGGKKLTEIDCDEAGASSIIVTGAGVESIGNYPDYYADGIFTSVLLENRQEFLAKPLDPALTAENAEKQEEILARIAQANKLAVNDLEVVIMDREREAERLAVLRKLQDKYPGLRVVTITDGTVAHSLLANFGRQSGKHKVAMTVSAAPEGFYNLSVAGFLKASGALASLRVYSKNVNLDSLGEKALNLKQRYNFDESERREIEITRPNDCQAILAGEKLFTQEDVRGDISGSFSFITHNGVFGVKGAEKLPQGYYQVSVLRVGKVNDRPCVWIEKRVIDPLNELEAGLT